MAFPTPPTSLPGGITPAGTETKPLTMADAPAPGPVVVATPSTRPMDPKAAEKVKAANDPFAGLEQVQAPAAADPFAGLEPVGDAFSGLPEADDLDLKDEAALVDDDAFNPAEYLSANPQVSKDAEKSQKLLNVYRARRVRGLEAGKVARAAVTEAPGIVKKVAGGVKDLAERTITLGIQPAANKLFGFLTGASKEEQAAIDAETGKEQLKAASEITAGTETAVTGLGQLAQQGYRKLFGKSPEKATDSELLDDLYLDAEFSKTMKSLAEGEGDASKLIGLDADTLSKNGIVLDKEAIERLSLVDPVTMVGTAGIFKVVGLGGKVLATAATRAGADAVITGLKTAAARSIQAAGRGVQAVGKSVQKTAEVFPAKSVGAVVGGAQTGTLTGVAVGAAAGEASKKIAIEGGEALARKGAGLAELGEQLVPGFTGPKTAGLQRISNLAASPVGQVAGGAAKGAATGVVSAAPLALAADDSQTAGALLGAGAALGGIAGGIGATKQVAIESIAKNYLDPAQISFEPTKSPAYGTDANLDATHDAAIQSLAPNQQNAVNAFREAVRAAGGEIYVQDPASYRQRIRENLASENGGTPLTPEQEARVELYAQTHAEFDGVLTDAQGNPRRVVFLNNSAKGLAHDSGHLFQSLLSPDTQAQLRQSVFESYTPEQLNAFREEYQARLGDPEYFNRLGEEAAREKVADEIIAENYGQLFRNTPLANLRAPRTFLQKLGQTAVNAAEALGIDLTGGRVTPDLQAAPSYRLQGILRNAAQEVLTRPEAPMQGPALQPEEVSLAKPATDLPTPTPAIKPTGLPEVKPAIPTPEAKAAEPTQARNIRATETQQKDFAATRAEETGIAEAQKASEANPELRATVDTIAKSMQEGNPVLEIEHRGIASERGPGAPEGRASRRSTQAQGYEQLRELQVKNRQEAPADIVNEHQKTFVPVRFTTQGGKPTLIAMSLDKVISNVSRVVADAVSKNAESLIPYPVEGGKLTDAGWKQVVSDVKAYAENQSNGYRGDGQKLVRPEADAGLSIPAENPNYTPKPLSEAAMNFANLLQGLNPPETGRVQKGLTPGNVKGQILAEVNARQPMTPSVISPDNVKKQSFKGFEPRTVKETNPLRNELAARGVKVRELLEVTERVAVEDIAKVNPRPEIGFKAPVTDTIRGGFLPEKSAVEVETQRRLEEKRRAGIDLTETVRRKAREEAEFAVRNQKAPAPKKDLFFLPGNETDKAVRSGILPDPKPSEPTPSADIRKLAENYARNAGVKYSPARNYARVDAELAKQIADFYESAVSNPNDPAVRASYDALTREVLAQYQAMLDAGYTIEPFKGEGEPYKSSTEAVADIRNNRHLFFLQTEKAFGSGAEAPTNPMLADAGVSAGGVPLLVNDVFRAVHDFFGHGKEGYQFGPRGEFNAWRAHSEMFSPEAQGALAAETLAQNSWVNYGKHLRKADGTIPSQGQPGYKGMTERPFAEQKNLVIPDKLITAAREQSIKSSFLPDEMPHRELADRVMELSASDWIKETQSFDGGLTKEAHRRGLTMPDRETLAKYRELQAEATRRTIEAKNKLDTAEDMMAVLDEMTSWASRAQFFSEAIGAATDTGSAAKKDLGWRAKFPDGKSPFPETSTGPAFLPAQTEAGRALEPKGYRFKVTGNPGIRAVELYKDGVPVGEISSVQRSPKSAEVAMVRVDKDIRGEGVGEALYRELFSQLQKDGVELVEGTAVAPEPIAIRRKIFGGFDKLELNLEPTTPEEVFPLLEDLRSGRTKDLVNVEATNRIRPDMTFLPDDVKPKGRRNEKGEPLTKDGLVDYPKLYKEMEAARKAEEAANDATTDYSKYVTSEKAPKTEKPTGWILPDGKFVGLADAYHQDFLAKQSEKLNKKFGTSFEATSNVEDRLAALNKGFVRVRDYNGATSIELNQKFYKGAVKKTIEDRVLNGLDAIDKLRVSLLDDSGNVVDSASGKLFDAENPSAVATDLLNNLTPKSGTAKRGPGAIARARAMGDFLPADRMPADTDPIVRAAIQTSDGEIFTGAWHGEAYERLADAVNDGTTSFELPSGVDDVMDYVYDMNGPAAQGAIVDGFVTKSGKFLNREEALAYGKKIGQLPKNFKDETGLESRGFSDRRKFLPGEETALPGFEEKGGTSAEQRAVRNRVAESRAFPEGLALEFVKEDDGSYRLQNGKPVPILKDYELHNTPLAKESAKGVRGEGAREEVFTDALADRLVKTYKAAAKNPDVKAGEKWYSTARTRLRKLLGDDTKLFAELLGATSARTAVDLNFKFALEAYNQFKAGAYDAILDKYREGKRNFDAKEFGDYAEATKTSEPPTRAAYLDWWIETHKLTPLQSNGKKFGMNSRQVLKVLDGSWASEVQGPKTPNFTGNLAGTTFEATIDVWAMRLLHRLSNEGNDKRWRIQPGNETGVTDRDFYTGQKAFRKAAKTLDMKPDALQAVLWFAEKEFWERQGWTRSSVAEAKSDFNTLLAETEKTPSGTLRTKSKEQELDLMLSEDDIKPKKK